MKKWRVYKKIIEHHNFVLEAGSEQEALDAAKDYYCDSDDAADLDMVVVSTSCISKTRVEEEE